MFLTIIDARSEKKKEAQRESLQQLSNMMAAFVIVGVQGGVYQEGDLLRKGQSLYIVLKDLAEYAAYGMYIWSSIRYILGQRGEAVQLIKGTTLGYLFVQLLPMFFNIVKSVGRGY